MSECDSHVGGSELHGQLVSLEEIRVLVVAMASGYSSAQQGLHWIDQTISLSASLEEQVLKSCGCSETSYQCHEMWLCEKKVFVSTKMCDCNSKQMEMLDVQNQLSQLDSFAIAAEEEL